jgi:hypothetical protein
MRKDTVDMRGSAQFREMRAFTYADTPMTGGLRKNIYQLTLIQRTGAEVPGLAGGGSVARYYFLKGRRNYP